MHGFENVGPDAITEAEMQAVLRLRLERSKMPLSMATDGFAAASGIPSDELRQLLAEVRQREAEMAQGSEARQRRTAKRRDIMFAVLAVVCVIQMMAIMGIASSRSGPGGPAYAARANGYEIRVGHEGGFVPGSIDLMAAPDHPHLVAVLAKEVDKALARQEPTAATAPLSSDNVEQRVAAIHRGDYDGAGIATENLLLGYQAYGTPIEASVPVPVVHGDVAAVRQAAAVEREKRIRDALIEMRQRASLITGVSVEASTSPAPLAPR